MTTPTGLELVWANAGGASDPGDSKYQLGWIAEIPTFQNFNYVLQALDKAKLSYAEKDIHAWQDNINYQAGARVERGSKTYYCITSHNDLAGTNTQDPEQDTTNSYWVNGTVFSSLIDAYQNLKVEDGLLLDKVQSRGTSNTWLSNDVTIRNLSNIISLTTDSNAYDNLLFGNVQGKMVIINVGNTLSPDGRSLLPDSNANAFEVYHEGNKPVQADVSGTIPTEPQTGKLYGRRSGNWVEATTITIGIAPPPPTAGIGHTWYNLDDGRLYIDIDDGDSSQWVPASPPVVPDLLASGITTTQGDTVQQQLDNVVNKIYPVGSLYLCMDAVSPATKFGGAWSLVTGDATLSLGNGGTNTGAVLGANTHTLTEAQLPSHTHSSGSLTAVSGGAHAHDIDLGNNRDTSDPTYIPSYSNSGDSGDYTTKLGGTHSHNISGNTGSAGSNSAHNIRSAYITINVWQRTA